MLFECIRKLLDQIAKTEGFTKYTINSKAGSNDGDNFMGTLTAFTITGTKQCDKQQNLYLICKIPPLNRVRRDVFKMNLQFGSELYAYSKILPAFVRFQQAAGLSKVDSFLSFPKMYVSEYNAENDTHILILEDLRPNGFEMWQKEQIMAIDHEQLIMHELGKFHGISFAMKDQRPIEFQELIDKTTDNFLEVSIRGKFQSFFAKSLEKSVNVIKNSEHKKRVREFQKNFIDAMEELMNEPFITEFGVINHGDCWNNNFLFQYADDQKTKLKSICFLDWQFSRYGPPVLDLLYHIFGTTDAEYRKNNYENLLKTYYSSLSQTIQKLGSDPYKLYTFGTLQAQLKKYGKFGLLVATMIIQGTVAEIKDINDIDDYSERINRNEDVDLFRPFAGNTHEKFTKLINDLVTDLVNYEYI